MRQPRSRTLRRFFAPAAVAAAVSLGALPGAAGAQAGAEGPFLLLPVGARPVALGGSVVAQHGGSDALFWNPAGIGGVRGGEVAIHHSVTVGGQGNALALVISTGRGSAIGVAINALDFGTQTATDESGNPVGVITPTDFAYGVSYGVQFGRTVALGATVKHVEARIGCSGVCANLPAGGSSSNGGDVGVQLRPIGSPVTFGFAARNLGAGRADQRPGRLDLGADYLVPIRVPPQYAGRVEVHATVGAAATTHFDSLAERVGTDIALEGRLHVRAGYLRDPANGSGIKSVGIGLTSGKLVFDLAQTYGGLTQNGDTRPTYFSLRYLW